jgi:putative NIF3 family GTP cyclohydrolase 1 type 2
VNLVFGTHHLTETFGVRALGDGLAEQFGIATAFVNEEPDIR